MGQRRRQLRPRGRGRRGLRGGVAGRGELGRRKLRRPKAVRLRAAVRREWRRGRGRGRPLMCNMFVLLLARPIRKQSADASALVLGRVSVDSGNRFFPDPPAINRVRCRLVPGVGGDADLVRLVVERGVQRVRREEEEVAHAEVCRQPAPWAAPRIPATRAILTLRPRPLPTSCASRSTATLRESDKLM